MTNANSKRKRAEFEKKPQAVRIVEVVVGDKVKNLSELHMERRFQSKDQGGRMATRLGAYKSERKLSKLVERLTSCLEGDERVAYLGEEYTAQGKQYIRASRRWLFLKDLIEDEVIFDYPSLAARASNYVLGEGRELGELLRDALDEFAEVKRASDGTFLVPVSYEEQLVESICWGNKGKEVVEVVNMITVYYSFFNMKRERLEKMVEAAFKMIEERPDDFNVYAQGP